MGWFTTDVGSQWPAMYVDHRRSRELERDWVALVAELIRDTPRLGPQAACRSVDPAIFDIDAGDIGAAVGICRTCPVLAQCRSWALRGGLTHAVAGGLILSGGGAYELEEWLSDS